MRYLFLLIFVLLSLQTRADVYIITDKDGYVYSLSEQDDAALPEGYKKNIAKGVDIKSLPIGDDVSLYKYDGKFVVDKEKISNKEKKQLEKYKEREKEKMIQDKVREQAIAALVAEGKLSAEVK